ncbi:MAG: DUF481 domain-containing protein [Deltaproteobacteria bacterium]
MILALALLLGQATAPAPSSPPTAEQSAARAADAAEKAALAAQSAAQSAAQAAKAAETIASGAVPSSQQTAPTVPALSKGAAKGLTGTIDFGLIWLTGNTNTLTLNGSAAFSKRFQSGWIASFKGSGAYGQASPPEPSTPSTITALQASGQLRLDRLVSKLFSVYLLTGADTDHIASIEFRGYGEGGGSIFWLNRKEKDVQTLLLQTDVGFRYAKENQFQYFPVEARLPSLDMVSPRFGLSFRYAIGKNAVVSEVAEVIPDVLAPHTTLADSTTNLSAHLTESLALAVGYQLSYISVPAPGKVPTDAALNLGLEVSL